MVMFIGSYYNVKNKVGNDQVMIKELNRLYHMKLYKIYIILSYSNTLIIVHRYGIIVDVYRKRKYKNFKIEQQEI